MIYTCAKCGSSVSSTHETLLREQLVVRSDGTEDKIPISGRGLGTWHCPKCDDKMGGRWVTVTRDLSGGKESDKQRRAVPVSVRRHTLVITSTKEIRKAA